MVATRSSSAPTRVVNTVKAPSKVAKKAKKTATVSQAPKDGGQEAQNKTFAEGDTLPPGFPPVFTQSHGQFNLADESRQSGLVLFFYPKANTPGCTNQACSYNDNLQAFTDRGFKVFGVSADSEKSLTTWKNKYAFQYDFVSDVDRQIIGAFGLNKAGGGTIRSHVVIEKGGKVVRITRQTPAKTSWSDALDAINSLG